MAPVTTPTDDNATEKFPAVPVEMTSVEPTGFVLFLNMTVMVVA